MSAAPVDERKKIIQAAITKIKKDSGLQFNRLGDRVNALIPHTSTGIWRLDHELIGIGGVPRGKMIEIIGPEASGKTTLTLHVAAQAQKAGGEVAFVDVEHALSPTYANQLGVDVDNLLVAQPDWGEQALQAVEDLVDTKSINVIIVDSVAALLPKAELEGEIGDSHVGLQARLMGQALRKLVAKCNTSGTTILWINQIREKIGVMFGSNEVTPGGRALKFYCSVRIDVRRLAKVKVGEENAGNKTKIRCIKNKVDVPFRDAEFELIFGKGVDSVGSLVDCAIEHGVWKQTASNYMLKSTGEVIMGRKNVRDALIGNTDLYKQTEIDTLAALGKNQEYIDNVTKK
jgi:recombination protein RecA